MLNEETRSVNGGINESRLLRFRGYLDRYVHKLTIRGPRALGCCPFHDDQHPSFSAHLEWGVFHCFGCGVSGGVKKFAELVGEPWAVAWLPRQERRRIAVTIRRREAEQKARTILQQREEERLDRIFDEWREVNRDAVNAVEILALFHRRPDLEEAFPDLAEKAAHDYGAAIHRREWLEAVADGR